MKPIQIRYQLYYRIRKKWRSLLGYKIPRKEFGDGLSNILLNQSIDSYKSYIDKNEFIFLNKKKVFEGKIDWNCSDFGKLWTYNLNYFEFLHQKNFQKENGLILINDFIQNFDILKDGLEPFPTSLRIINWIKFLLGNKINDSIILNNLYTQIYLLLDNIEYHIQGNHLLENAFALLYGGIIFKDHKVLKKSEELLSVQLEEQILDDGAHFELSPMYHQHMFFRILDSINLINNSDYDNKLIIDLLHQKAILMQGWLKKMTFTNGDIPHFNDSSLDIAPQSYSLFNYADRLKVESMKVDVSDSGYRVFKNEKYELIIDTGKIGPDYIPGHGHCDIFSFVLYVDRIPVIVDTGTSVYGGNIDKRKIERNTGSHNTVKVEGFEQSQVWGDFRVARRSFPVIINENKNLIELEYKHFTGQYTHNRKIILTETEIEIIDSIHPNLSSKSILHFNSDVDLNIKTSSVDFGRGNIKFSNGEIEEKGYFLANGFNKTIESIKVEIKFESELKMTFKF